MNHTNNEDTAMNRATLEDRRVQLQKLVDALKPLAIEYSEAYYKALKDLDDTEHAIATIDRKEIAELKEKMAVITTIIHVYNTSSLDFTVEIEALTKDWQELKKVVDSLEKR